MVVQACAGGAHAGNKRPPQIWTAPVAVHTHPPCRTLPQESVTSCNWSAQTVQLVVWDSAVPTQKAGWVAVALQHKHTMHNQCVTQSLQSQARQHPNRCQHTAIYADD